MIIDHNKKLIFSKTRKTGGSSVQIALSQVLDSEALIVGSVSNDGIIDETNSAGRNRSMVIGSLNHPHTPLQFIKDYLGNKFDDYFKFTFVRNPYDLVVSRYKWDLKKAGNESEQSIEHFRRWLRKYCSSGICSQDFQSPYYTVDGEALDVFIGRYESLEADYQKLCKQLDIIDPPLLGWHKKSQYRDHYSIYYDAESIALVATYFVEDLAMLGYEFERYEPYTVIGERVRVIDKVDVGDDNVNGPCVIADDEGYIMYYANHRGTNIRKIISEGNLNSFNVPQPIINALDLSETPCKTHIASPHVDDGSGRQRIMMYHGDDATGKQHTYVVGSDKPIGHFYFRCDGDVGIAKKGNECGVLYECNGDGDWIEKFDLIPKMRHADIQLDGKMLSIFYTQAEDTPEHIRVCVINIDNWEVVNDYELLRPKELWEGVDAPLVPSKFGAVWDRVNQLRDPYLFIDGDKRYLFYSYAGESGIAYVELEAQ